MSLRYTTTTTVHPGFLQILRSLFLSLNGSETDLLFNLPWVTVVALLILNLQLLPNEDKNYCETNDVCFVSVTFRLHKLDTRKRSVPCIPTFRKRGKSACCDLETWQ